MAVYTRRVQTVLTEAQFELLSHLAEEQGKPLSHLIRDAVEQVYFQRASLERRREALSNLISLDAPVDDWNKMEDEIIRGALE